MRLKELEIQGFKSFPDKTRITIGEGITGVVGPNGSGKSNISDSIRWVLGETSSKQLRGAGKMEDVIFGGTQTRGAMGYAAVSLTIDNSDHGLEMDADEVTIGRRYYRSGESEYTINGQSVRLKDVYELLLDTGLGRDGYAIVGQGRIAEIVGAKSTERREIFEEASGIAKYRYRKNEAERRLAAAEGNLERLRDILGELEKRVGPLKRDSEKAEQFLAYSETRKGLEITLWVDSIRRAQDTVRDQQRKYEAAESDYARISRQLDEFDTRTEALRAEAQQLMLQVEEANAEIRTITEQNAGSESQLAVLQNETEHANEQIRSASDELTRAGEGAKGIAQEADEHKAEITQLQTVLQNLDAEADKLRQQLNTLEQQALQSGERREIVSAAMARMQQNATALQVRGAGLQSAVEAARAQLNGLKNQEATAGDVAQKLTEERDAAAEHLKECEEAVTRNDNIRSGLKLKLDSRRRQQAEAAEALQKAAADKNNTAQRIRILEDLERNMDGYQQSVKAVMRAAGGGRLRGIIGPVAGILSVRKGYEIAIETALGFALQNIVVQDQGCARAAITFLKEERAGRATFLPLDTVQGSRFNGRLTGTAEVAADLVETAPQYQHIIDNLLGRIIVVEDLGEASVVAKNLGYRNRIVTMDGQVINAGGSFTGGSTARSVGVFSRKQELDELRAKVLKLDERRAAAEKEATARKAEVDNLTAQLAGAESEGMTAAAARLKAEMELDQLNTALEEGKNAAAHRGQEIAALEQQLRENTAAAAQAENARKQAEAEIETHRKELESLGASTSDVTRQREEASQKLSDNRMQKLRTEKDLSLQANVAAAKERIAANELRANEIKRASEENKQKITAAEETIRKANAERMEKEAAVTRLTQENRTLTDERERMSGEMARLAERKTAAKTELNTTASKLWEEYQLTEAEAEKLCVPFANVADLRRQVAEVRGKIRALGNVNVGAIEEYKEVKERYDFMKAQVTDVEKSRAELNRMIAELCSEMQEMFIKNLSALSGGEQALVAISIYFAILAVNPSPFCILDEIEAALDDVNVTRYAQYLRRMTERTQFIVITHRRGTMEAADVLYGVTMQEDGVSKILRLDLENVSADLIS